MVFTICKLGMGPYLYKDLWFDLPKLYVASCGVILIVQLGY